MSSYLAIRPYTTPTPQIHTWFHPRLYTLRLTQTTPHFPQSHSICKKVTSNTMFTVVKFGII
jgi:hypothetical protein